MTVRPIPAEIKKQMQRSLVKSSDMPSELCAEIVDIVVGAIDKFSTSEEPDLEGASRLVKDTLDKQYGPVWHCAMGKGFSFDVTAQVSFLSPLL
jgi:dynein light chain 4, axonemal